MSLNVLTTFYTDFKKYFHLLSQYLLVYLRRWLSFWLYCCSVWDHAKMCLFNWLWYETTTFLPYTEETSYENSLLVQQTGALALSSLTHVLRSLTPNARYSTTWLHLKQANMHYFAFSFLKLQISDYSPTHVMRVWFLPLLLTWPRHCRFFHIKMFINYKITDV